MGALRTLRKYMRRQNSTDPKRRPPQFELLEPRLLLSVEAMSTELAQPLLVDLYPGMNDVALRLTEIDGHDEVVIER